MNMPTFNSFNSKSSFDADSVKLADIFSKNSYT